MSHPFIPRIDLHCHLDGSLPLAFMEELAAEAGIPVPAGEKLRQLVQAPPDTDSLDTYLKCFDLPVRLLQTPGAVRRAVPAVLADMAKDHVIYTELRFAPLLHETPEYSLRAIIEDAIEGTRDGYAATGIRCGIILCAMRHMSVEENLRMLRIGREYLGSGVCALDLAGSEAMFPVTLHREMFHEARRLGMPFTIHAGECGSAASVRDAIELGAARIGHGIAIAKDPELRKLIKDRRIPLEMCPISNMQTKAAASPKVYPFPLFYEEGLPITINTDNRQVSGTTLAKEFSFLRDHYGLTPESELWLTRNAIEAAFAPDSIKQELLQ